MWRSILLLSILASIAPIRFASFAFGGDDSKCPYCKNDPKLMAAAGVISHGPISIGPRGSEDLSKELAGPKWLFIETAHLRWAFSLGASKVDQADRAKIDPLLDKLRKVLPLVPQKPKTLDPFLRLHLLAMRGEDLYARFQAVLHVADADFPESRPLKGPFMGDGKFLGEKDKFEVVIHANRASHKSFTKEFTGTEVTDSLRWHFPKIHKLLVSVPAEDSDLKEDRWLFAHCAHNLSHAFLCAYKHFSYDPPIWLDEGLAWAMEKEVEPTSQTTDGEEGSMRDTKGPKDPWAEAKRVAASAKAPTLAELMYAKNFGDLKQPQCLIAWAMVRFLIEAHGDEFAKFVGAIKGQLDAKGLPSGANLTDLERDQLRALWSWTPQQFDEAFKSWIEAKR